MRLSFSHLRGELDDSFLDLASSFDLLTAERDDLGQTHLRLNQVKNQIPVFGGQLTAHIDTQDEVRVFGRIFKEAVALETVPLLDAATAITRAKAALGYMGSFEQPPEGRLVILPDWIISQQKNAPKATLTYFVELLIEDGTENTARHFYFIDASNGEVTWHYDNLQRQAVTVGTGHSLYSGTVNFNTTRPFWTVYWMEDRTKCPGCNTGNPTGDASFTIDMRNETSGSGYVIFDQDNIWGDTTQTYNQRIASDAHFGMSKTWDYFNNVHGRYGIDGNGYGILSRVRYGVNFVNAFWDGSKVTYGDGDGSAASPLVSIDVVGHEITHGLTERTAGLIYANESGGANESFSDIFGTAVEFYSGINPDYLIGEDFYTPGIPNDALRYMYDPPLDGISIDHYSNYFPGMDVHYSSGIQNKAFHLLATSRGRDVAERIFYRALTVYLFPSATFQDVRVATLNAAADLYGIESKHYGATGSAWDEVGVF